MVGVNSTVYTVVYAVVYKAVYTVVYMMWEGELKSAVVVQVC